MKYLRYLDVETTGGQPESTAPIEISPRYSRVEFRSSVLAGTGLFDINVQGQSPRYGVGPQFNVPLDEDEWTLLVTGEDVTDEPTTLGSRESAYDFYRAVITSVGDMTIRFTVVGIRE